jgi:hypothetical protein
LDFGEWSLEDSFVLPVYFYIGVLESKAEDTLVFFLQALNPYAFRR